MRQIQNSVLYKMEKFYDWSENISFDSPKQKAMITQLYKDLKFAKLVEDLEVHQFKDLPLIYITGMVAQFREIFIPLATDETVTMNRFSTLHNELLSKHEASRLTLALMDADSTTVYFCLTPGLLPPTNSQTESSLEESETIINN